MNWLSSIGLCCGKSQNLSQPKPTISTDSEKSKSCLQTTFKILGIAALAFAGSAWLNHHLHQRENLSDRQASLGARDSSNPIRVLQSRIQFRRWMSLPSAFEISDLTKTLLKGAPCNKEYPAYPFQHLPDGSEIDLKLFFKLKAEQCYQSPNFWTLKAVYFQKRIALFKSRIDDLLPDLAQAGISTSKEVDCLYKLLNSPKQTIDSPLPYTGFDDNLYFDFLTHGESTELSSIKASANRFESIQKEVEEIYEKLHEKFIDLVTQEES